MSASPKIKKTVENNFKFFKSEQQMVIKAVLVKCLCIITDPILNTSGTHNEHLNHLRLHLLCKYASIYINRSKSRVSENIWLIANMHLLQEACLIASLSTL